MARPKNTPALASTTNRLADHFTYLAKLYDVPVSQMLTWLVAWAVREEFHPNERDDGTKLNLGETLESLQFDIAQDLRFCGYDPSQPVLPLPDWPDGQRSYSELSTREKLYVLKEEDAKGGPLTIQALEDVQIALINLNYSTPDLLKKAGIVLDETFAADVNEMHQLLIKLEPIIGRVKRDLCEADIEEIPHGKGGESNDKSKD